MQYENHSSSLEKLSFLRRLAFFEELDCLFYCDIFLVYHFFVLGNQSLRPGFSQIWQSLCLFVNHISVVEEED